MGFRFRRSFKLLPGLRLNLNGSGASVSFGPRGFHYTIGPKGNRVSVGIPGTGLSWTDYAPHTRVSEDSVSRDNGEGSENTAQGLVPIESTSAQHQNAFSTSELAPLLAVAQQRWRSLPYVLIVGSCIFVLSQYFNSNATIVGIAIGYTVLSVAISVGLDRYYRSVKITCEPGKIADGVARGLAISFGDLVECNSVWNIPAEGKTSDWKRNAGAQTLNARRRIYPKFDKPSCLRGPITVPALAMGDQIYFLPDAALFVRKKSVAAIQYRDLNITFAKVRFIEEETPPSDTQIVDKTWRYVNKKGGPDRRFNFNKELPICLYGAIDFQSEAGLNCKIHLSNPDSATRFLKVIEVLHKPNSELSGSISSCRLANRWQMLTFCILYFVFGVLISSQIVSQSLPNTKSAVSPAAVPLSVQPAESGRSRGIQKSAIQERSLDNTNYSTPRSASAPKQDTIPKAEPASPLPPARVSAAAPLPRPRPKSAGM